VRNTISALSYLFITMILDLEPTADIQSVGKDGLLVLARPNPEHSDRLKKSWDSIRKENKELKAVKGTSGYFLCYEFF
jgi:hypothetical protein